MHLKVENTFDLCDLNDFYSVISRPMPSDMSIPGTNTSDHTHRWGELLSDILSSSATLNKYVKRPSREMKVSEI